MLRVVQTADLAVVLVADGLSEASDGAAVVKRFDCGLHKLISKLQQPQQHVIWLTPLVVPGYRVPGYTYLVDQCRDIVGPVGAEADVPVISINWTPARAELTNHPLLPNDRGYTVLAD